MPEDSDGAGRLTRSLDCRYAGQEYALTVDVPGIVGQGLPDAVVIKSLFEVAHRNSFGYELDDAVEIVAVRATVRQELGQFVGQMPAPAREGGRVDPTHVEVWSFRSGKYEKFSVVDRGSLASEVELEDDDSSRADCDDLSRLRFFSPCDRWWRANHFARIAAAEGRFRRMRLTIRG